MARSRKYLVQKKIEQLRKTREIDDIVERGRVEEQALLDSAGETRPADESHIIDLLTKAQQQSDESFSGNMSSQRKSVRKKIRKSSNKKKTKKAKKSRR